MKFKVTISDEKGEILTTEMPENCEFIFDIDGKDVRISNKVDKK